MIKPWRWCNKRLLYVLSAPCQGTTSAFHILTRRTCIQYNYAPAVSAWRLRQSTEQHPVDVYWTMQWSGAMYQRWCIRRTLTCYKNRSILLGISTFTQKSGKGSNDMNFNKQAKSRGYKTPTTERFMGHLKTVWSIRKHNNSIVELIEPQFKIILGS